MDYMIDVPLAQHRAPGVKLCVYPVGYVKGGDSPLYRAGSADEAQAWINERHREAEESRLAQWVEARNRKRNKGASHG